MMKCSSDSFHGTIIKSSVSVSGLTFSETAYQPKLKLSKHSHAMPYFSFILQGSFVETYEKRSSRRHPLTLVFHPAEETHSNCFDTTTRGFNFQMQPEWIERTSKFPKILDHTAGFRGGLPSRLAMRLYQEFCNLDDLSPLIIEGLMLEILGEVARCLKRRSDASPPWLAKARELLNDQYKENLTLSQIAKIIGVHETHLAREFRRFYGCTLGDYVRRLRIEFACHQLLVSDASLTEVALSAGFFDQSHFARTFKSRIGMTPLAYRLSFRHAKHIQRP